MAALNKLQLSLNEDYHGARNISSEELLSLLFNKKMTPSFSAEIYMSHKDRGNLGDKAKGKVCTTLYIFTCNPQ